jgi:plastocyanin
MKRIAILSLIAVFAAVGCGGSSSSTSSSGTGAPATTSSGGGGGGGTQLALAADPSQLKFDKSQLNAPAGKVTITMTNPSPLQHDVSIKGGVNVQGNVVGQGGKSVASADLKPGQYTFYCSVDGHESAGMTGTLTVK